MLNMPTKKKTQNVRRYRDRHGKLRIEWRKKGYRNRPIPHAWGSDEFYAALDAINAEIESGVAIVIKPGEKRTAYGSIAWLVGEYLGNLAFTARPASVQQKHRRHLERFRIEHGHRLAKQFDQDAVEALLARMTDTPAAANQWLDGIRDLCKFAVRKKHMATDPTAGIKKLPPKQRGGHHPWTDEEMDAWEATYPLGTRARMAYELGGQLALRRSDIIRVGRLQMKHEPRSPNDPTMVWKLCYTQWKGRNSERPKHMRVEISERLMVAIEAMPKGDNLFLLDGNGNPFTEDAFSHWYADCAIAAGLTERNPNNPKWLKCTPHGIRKRACGDLALAGVSSREGMAVSGHATSKEWDRYTEGANSSWLASTAISKREIQTKRRTSGV
jgi:hypothetical protein